MSLHVSINVPGNAGSVSEQLDIKQFDLGNYSYAKIENIFNKISFFEKVFAEKKGFVATGNHLKDSLNKGILGNFHVYNQEFLTYLNEEEKKIYFYLLDFFINNMQKKIDIANQKNNIYIPFSVDRLNVFGNGINDCCLTYNFQIESQIKSLQFNNKKKFENLISDVCCSKKNITLMLVYFFISILFLFFSILGFFKIINNYNIFKLSMPCKESVQYLFEEIKIFSFCIHLVFFALFLFKCQDVSKKGTFVKAYI